MSDLGRRLLVGLGAAIAVAVAIGFGLIAGGIASPLRGDRAVLDLPPSGTAVATILDDGRPVFVVNDPGLGAWVLDAQQPEDPGRLGDLVAWCPETRTFVDPADGAGYAANGELVAGPAEGGLVAFATRPAADDSTRIVVGSDTRLQGRASPQQMPAGCGGALVVHEPQGDETFDPSVAADQEPPGWIWLEGTARTVEGQVRLCDGLAGACDRYAETIGIDPARAQPGAGGLAGLFIGRVRDGAIEGLIHVPDQVEAVS